MKRKKFNLLAFWIIAINLANIVIVRETSSFIVLECPGSTVNSIRQQVTNNEISAIFYYTHWNEKSLDVYTLYNVVSSYYSDYIQFAAIDCGHRTCNCSFVQLPRVQKIGRGLPNEWPTLIVYVQNNNFLEKEIIRLQYFGGWRLSPLMQFFQYLLQPIERLETKRQLDMISLETDKVIVGLFKDGFSNEEEYRNYAIAAIQWLEYDNRRSCRFLAAFGKQYHHLLFNNVDNDDDDDNENNNNNSIPSNMPMLVCMAAKGIITQTFDNGKQFNNHSQLEVSSIWWNTSNIIEWFQKCIISHDNDGSSNQRKAHLHGHSSPVTIARVLKHSPLLVILPRQIEAFINYMLKNVTGIFTTIFDTNLYSGNFSICEQHLIEKNPIRIEYFLDEVNSMISIGFHPLLCPITEQLEIEYHSMLKRCPRKLHRLSSIDYLRSYYDINKYYDQLLLRIYNPMLWIDNNILQSLPSLQQIHLFTNCLKFGNLTESVQLRITIAHYIENLLETIYHKHKIYNSTLNVIIPDESNAYIAHLKSLNIPIESDNRNYHEIITNNNETMANILIIDNSNESIYIMSKNFSIQNLSEFIIDYHDGNLQPIQRRHHHGKDESIANDLRFINNSIHVEDIDSDEFLKSIQTNNQNVTLVILMYSTTCALCAGLQQTFLQIAAGLRHERHLIRFLRINIYSNDLPWQFTMSYVPKLIVFPRDHYDDSVIFAQKINPTYGNVLSFILAQMTPFEQIQILLTVCKDQTVLWQRRYTCWKMTKLLLIEHINHYMKSIKKYRVNDPQIPLILQRLRSLKQLSVLLLGH